ncbi:DUF2953 domain-containing protein [Chloroflexota bacterium]
MWVILTLAGLAILIILVFCVPLDATFNIDTSEKLRFRLRIAWFFGLISKELHREKKKPEEKKKVAEEKQKKKRRIEFRTVLKILQTEGLLKQVKNLVKGVLGQLKIRDLVANFKVGLGNPAETGILFAIVGPATAFLSSLTSHEIRIQPAFGDEAILEGFSYGKVRLRPIQLIVPLLRPAFSLATLRVVKTLILSKWKRKK